MASINFLTPVTFDFGALAQTPKVLARLGAKRPLIVTDAGLATNGLLQRLLDALGAMPAAIFAETPANPTETASRTAATLYRDTGADSFIALGGGSPMDLAKFTGLLISHEGPYEKYGAAERGMRLIGKIPPLLAIPTTAGTGSEVSVGALIILDSGRKETFVSPHLLPRAAICDPDLTLALPPLLTAATGMDAVTHCFEAVLSPVINPPAEAIGIDGVERALGAGALERAVSNGADTQARWDMMMASLEGGLAFGKGLGAVHGLSHALGRVSDLKLHHGTLNAVILPHALAMIGDAAAEKFARLRRAMRVATDADLAREILALNGRIGLPASLSAMGVRGEHWPAARPYALTDLATGTNAIPFEAGAYDELFARAL